MASQLRHTNGSAGFAGGAAEGPCAAPAKEAEATRSQPLVPLLPPRRRVNPPLVPLLLLRRGPHPTLLSRFPSCSCTPASPALTSSLRDLARRNTNSHLSRRGGSARSRAPTTRETPSLFRQWTSIQTILRLLQDDLCQAVSHPGLSLRGLTSPAAPDATQSQEAIVPHMKSRMFWQFRESHVLEPSLPSPSLN